jgi:hypothetical protein
MGRHRILPNRKQYEKDYWQKVRKPKEQAEEKERRIHSRQQDSSTSIRSSAIPENGIIA